MLKPTVSALVDRIQRAGKKILVNDAGHAVITDLSTGVVRADSSGVLTSSPLGNGDLGADTQRPNLLVNGGFEIWQRGTSFAAMATNAYACDRWLFTKGGTSALTTTQETSIVDTASRYSAKLVYTHNAASTFRQTLEDPYQLRGLTLTLSMRVRSNAASSVRLRIDDNAGSGTAGSYHTGGGAFETLTATKVIDAAATSVAIIVELNATATTYLDNAMLVIGGVAATYVPFQPADDLLRCLRYYEFFGGTSTQEPISTGWNNTTSTAYTVMTYQRKAVAPTVTVSAAGDWTAVYQNNASAMTTLAGGNIGLAKCEITGAATGTPFTVGQGCEIRANATANARVSLEANP